LLSGCGDSRIVGVPDPERVAATVIGKRGADAAGMVTVMTRNLYVGANLDLVLTAPSPADIPIRVAEAFAAVQATTFPERAEALADEIAAADPHLVGLQEVSLIRTQFPGDFLVGNPTPAEDVAFDFLALLMGALEARGLDYRAVATSRGIDIELPMFTGFTTPLADARLTDHEVILARSDVAVSDVQERNFTVNLAVPVGGGPPIPILRGWAAVTATVAGRTYRVVSTHLEPASIPPIEAIQVAQGNELLGVLSGETRPVILLGDFNSAADGSTTATYGNIVAGGFVDAWNRTHRRDPGFTCCQAADLRNGTSLLDERIDVIFVRDDFEPVDARIVGAVQSDVVGEDPGDRTPSGLWPSDHAGVAATFQLRRGRRAPGS
ncbi:MAG: endonuclease/exonuclease/phosphatase family protein, partial [bacterium]